MLIEFSGIDGAGKTTFVERVMRLFNSAGVPCYQRSFPSTFKRVAADLAVAAGHRHWSGLFPPNEIETAHAFEMLNLVSQQLLPLDLDRQVIVTDTYVSKWLADSILWKSDAAERLGLVYGGLPAPDLSFRLQVSVDEAARRIAERPKGDHPQKIGPDSVLGRYAAAYEQAAPLVPYPRETVFTETGLAESWKQIQETIVDRVQAGGRHQALLDAVRHAP
ncbi:hypothetical protein [Actinomadura rayongensis]|uniref:Thymidylate kinase-like domain-containing protein n=1 Tax=Actinomadura rayongensis TaxID=1429076 RepID=A0A6I4WAX7_9ACTN|nr:hypothetical protein [Actinomadura rayongensis]MXQ66273.1 hypothetical protein [Actinomadura rayongensis]